jgi:apolipoprotein N-acyltransferase
LPFVVLPLWLFVSAKFSLRPFVSGWWFGLGFFGAGISWVHVSIATFGGVPLAVSILLMLLLCSYLALFPALFSFFLKRYFKVSLWPLAAPLIWLATEWLRANFLSGFPWLSIGYSQANGILSPFFPIIGEIGVSLVMILLSATLVSGLMQRTRQGLTSIVTVFGVIIVSALLLKQQQWVMPTAQTRTAALVQGNIEQSVRWRPETDQATMQKYLSLSESAWGADLIIWPEAAVPRLEILAIDYLNSLDTRATEHNSALITGVVDVNIENEEAFNKLLALGLDTETENTQAYSYPSQNKFAKHHLLPIGEFVPFEAILRPLAPIFDLPMSSFSRGDYVQANLNAKGLQVAPAICFEIAFPQQIAANITAQTDLIVTVSNDAWFGDSHGPHQHLQIARVRAMEFGLPVLRATNTGVTAAYDHNGELLGKLPQFTDGVLNIEFSLVEGATPYLRFGNVPSFIFGSLSLLIAMRLERRSKVGSLFGK